MSRADWDGERDGAARAARLAAYRAQGIEIAAAFPSRAWAAAGPAWSWEWLQPRLIAADHVRHMLHSGRVVGVMTQPYWTLWPRSAGAQHRTTTHGGLCRQP